MRKYILPLAFVLACFTTASVWADSGNSTQSGADPTSSASSQKQKSNSSSGASGLDYLPARMASFVVGSAVGTPISFVRCMHRELIKQTKEAYTLGGMPPPLGWVTAGLFGIPSGVLCGVWYGSTDGVIDGWVGSKEPFSKQAFSLDKLEY